MMVAGIRPAALLALGTRSMSGAGGVSWGHCIV